MIFFYLILDFSLSVWHVCVCTLKQTWANWWSPVTLLFLHTHIMFESNCPHLEPLENEALIFCFLKYSVKITEHQQNVVWETSNKSSIKMFFPYLSFGYLLTFLAFRILSLILTYCLSLMCATLEIKGSATGPDLIDNILIDIRIDAKV